MTVDTNTESSTPVRAEDTANSATPERPLTLVPCTRFKHRVNAGNFIHVCMTTYVWKWTLFRLTSFLAIICHFNEKRASRMWCVDDILWPNVDKSATFTVTLLKQWQVATIETDLQKERSSAALFVSSSLKCLIISPFFPCLCHVWRKAVRQDKGEKVKKIIKKTPKKIN